MSWPALLGRVAVRTGIALWRQRIALIVAGVVVVAFGAYSLTFAGPAGPAAVSGSNGDCADTAMQALTHVNDSTARAAYQCLGPGMRTTSEDEFVATLQQRALSSGQASRVADRETSDGGKIVFYTVSAGNTPSVGYIVYLDHSGKVVKVE
jgi:hypothetical protein